MGKFKTLSVTGKSIYEQNSYNEDSCSFKHMNIQGVIDKAYGYCLSATYIGKAHYLLLINTTDNVIWVRIGDENITSSTNPLLSFPILPKTEKVYFTHINTHIILNVTGVCVYSLKDDIKYSE